MIKPYMCIRKYKRNIRNVYKEIPLISLNVKNICFYKN